MAGVLLVAGRCAERGEHAADLVGRAGQARVAVCESGPGDGKEGKGEHGEGNVAVPALVAPDLVVVHPGFVRGSLEALLSGWPGGGSAPSTAHLAPATVTRRLSGAGPGVWQRQKASSDGRETFLRISSEISVRTEATSAQSQRRLPFAPSPQLIRCQARLGSFAARASARRPPAGVARTWARATART